MNIYYCNHRFTLLSSSQGETKSLLGEGFRERNPGGWGMQ